MRRQQAADRHAIAPSEIRIAAVVVGQKQTAAPQNQNGPLQVKRAVLGVNPKVLVGGAREDRTPDLLNAIQALSHLSYDPAGKTRAMGGAMPGV
jgi:hypothetical protein